MQTYAISTEQFPPGNEYFTTEESCNAIARTAIESYKETSPDTKMPRIGWVCVPMNAAVPDSEEEEGAN